MKKVLDLPKKIRIIRTHNNNDVGWLAQLVEHLPYTQRVSGSSPLPPTIIKKSKNESFWIFYLFLVLKTFSLKF